jgi:hypothetical protein
MPDEEGGKEGRGGEKRGQDRGQRRERVQRGDGMGVRRYYPLSLSLHPFRAFPLAPRAVSPVSAGHQLFHMAHPSTWKRTPSENSVTRAIAGLVSISPVSCQNLNECEIGRAVHARGFTTDKL